MTSKDRLPISCCDSWSCIDTKRRSIGRKEPAAGRPADSVRNSLLFIFSSPPTHMSLIDPHSRRRRAFADFDAQWALGGDGLQPQTPFALTEQLGIEWPTGWRPSS